MTKANCDRCEEEFEYDSSNWPNEEKGQRPQYCKQCQDELEAEMFANIEAPEGGFRRGSDMDRI